MKSNVKMFAAIPALSLVLASPFTFAQKMEMECKGPKLTDKQVRALITSAKTAADHNKLACYYRSEAKAEEKKAKYHEEMGELYKSSSNAKHDMTTHCKQFAEEARKAAEADNQLAEEHEKMAMEAK